MGEGEHTLIDTSCARFARQTVGQLILFGASGSNFAALRLLEAGGATTATAMAALI